MVNTRINLYGKRDKVLYCPSCNLGMQKYTVHKILFEDRETGKVTEIKGLKCPKCTCSWFARK